jgi:hypothetical protein
MFSVTCNDLRLKHGENVPFSLYITVSDRSINMSFERSLIPYLILEVALTLLHDLCRK